VKFVPVGPVICWVGR